MAASPLSKDVAKELKVRKRVLAIYNKTEEDFGDKTAFDDYQEEVEEIVYNLVCGVDVTATEKRIEQYERENRDLILRNQARKAEQQRLVSRSVADLAAAAAALTAQAAGTTTDGQSGAGGYVATAQAPVVGLAAAPAPLQPYSDVKQQQRLTAEEREAMGLASGWTADLPNQRAKFEAFTQLFVS